MLIASQFANNNLTDAPDANRRKSHSRTRKRQLAGGGHVFGRAAFSRRSLCVVCTTPDMARSEFSGVRPVLSHPIVAEVSYARDVGIVIWRAFELLSCIDAAAQTVGCSRKGIVNGPYHASRCYLRPRRWGCQCV